jgi:hypothetical protein
MNIPYTYFLLHKPTGKKYYGARWSKNCHPTDLWQNYFTSSKHVKKLIEEYGKNSFVHSVRKTFNSVDECRKWEERVLRKLNVTSNDSWLNKNVNGKFLPYGKQSKEHIQKRTSKTKGSGNGMFGKHGPANPFYGKHHSKETIEKLSKPKTEEHKLKLPYQKLNHLKVECPYCKKTGQYVNMKRWHFDRCKSIPERPVVFSK